jgi:hypothetical protein
MIKIYVALIRAGKRTLEQVPEQWRDAVAAALEE